MGVMVWLLLSCIYGIILAPFKIGTYNLNRDFLRFLAWGCLRIMNLKVEIEGEQFLHLDEPTVFIGNHQSGLDLVTYGILCPKRSVAIGKIEILVIPIFGVFFWMAGNILIKRQNRKKARHGIMRAAQLMRERNVNVGIFPEGTRNKTDEPLLPFKKGGFHLAVMAQAPIVPIVLEPVSHFVDFHQRRFVGNRLRFKVLPPISTMGKTIDDVDQLLQTTRAQMIGALNQLSRPSLEEKQA